MEESHHLIHDYYIRHLACKYFQQRYSHYRFVAFTAFVAVYSSNEKSANFFYLGTVRYQYLVSVMQ
jgi:hypothetical protein